MALITCSECGHQVSDRASKCPYCGCPIDYSETTQIISKDRPQNNRNYKDNKDIWTFVLCFFAVLLVVGLGYLACSDSKPKVKVQQKKQPVVQVQQDYATEVETAPKYDGKNAVVSLTPEFIQTIKKYDSMGPFSEGYAAVYKNGKYGYIDVYGEEVIPVNINADYVGIFSEGLAAIAPGIHKKFYVIDTNGNTVFKSERDIVFDAEGECASNDDMPYYINGRLYVENVESPGYDVYDKNGNFIETVDFEVGYNFYQNHKKSGSYYIFSQNNEGLDDYDYDSNGRDVTYGLKDYSGNVVLDAIYDAINGQKEGSVNLSNGVLYVTITEYTEEEQGQDGHVEFYYGYADLSGNDTFSKALKKRCRQSKIDAAKRAEKVAEERLKTEGPSWLQGAWVLYLYDNYGNIVGYTHEVFNKGKAKCYLNGNLILDRSYTIYDNIIQFNSITNNNGGYYNIDNDQQRLISANGQYFKKVSEDCYYTP